MEQHLPYLWQLAPRASGMSPTWKTIGNVLVQGLDASLRAEGGAYCGAFDESPGGRKKAIALFCLFVSNRIAAEVSSPRCAHRPGIALNLGHF